MAIGKGQDRPCKPRKNWSFLHEGARRRIVPLDHFGSEVRRARTSAGMTLADLGAPVPCDGSMVSRIEAGQLSPSERFAAACDEAFPQMGGWFSRFYQDSRKWDGPYPRWFVDWVVAEREALTLRMWGLELVPGLLQTPDYATELFRAWQPSATDDELDELVNGRIERQLILDKADPPELWVVAGRKRVAPVDRIDEDHARTTASTGERDRQPASSYDPDRSCGHRRARGPARRVRYRDRRQRAGYVVRGHDTPGADSD